jgi:DNA mismatch endonuclease (patch repair protein)
MRDLLTKTERSALMAKVRSRENKSTEKAVEQVLVLEEIRGWIKHPKAILGRPDFYFPRNRLALFIDGCFWHGCPLCQRRIPSTRMDFWRHKIGENRRRDKRVRRKLRSQGFHAMSVWEHDLLGKGWLKRLRTLLLRSIARPHKPISHP